MAIQFITIGESPTEPHPELVELVHSTDVIVLVRSVPLSLAGRSDEVDPTAPSLDRESDARRIREGEADPDRSSPVFGLARLEVLEVIKGEGADQIYLAAQIMSGDPAPGDDFNAHTEARFWSHADVGLRTLINTSGKSLIHINSEYLVFVGSAHPKGQELILTEDDAWLAFVRETVAAD